MNAEISETIKATNVGFGMQILEVLAQRKWAKPKHIYNKKIDNPRRSLNGFNTVNDTHLNGRKFR